MTEPIFDNVAPEEDFRDQDSATLEDRLTEQFGGKTDPNKTVRRTTLQRGLERFYSNIGNLVFVFDQPCGTVIMTNAEEMATAMDALAKENASVRRFCEYLVESSAVGMAIAAHAPVAMAITLHHSKRARELMGRVTERATDNATNNGTNPFAGVG